MNRDDQAWAVFWCSLLSPLRLGEVEEAEREAYFRSLAQEERRLPNGQRRRFSVRTLRRWWRRLRDEGVDGLMRRPRSDRGQPRTRQQELLARAVELKKEQPSRSDVVINRILQREFGRGVPRSTLYRHLHRNGATRRKLGVSQQKVRCRWTRDQAGALWVGDFEHGPAVLHQGRSVTTHLSAWIDCHSRYIIDARYYIREDLDILVDSLLRAWTHRGASRELYVDNAKIYHANALKLACAELNIQLLHRPPRDPAPGGLIERFFQTLQGQLEAEIRATRQLSLGDINQSLQAWLNLEYHEAIHRETGESPRQRYESSSRFQRFVEPARVIRLFCRRERRVVHRDFSDVVIQGRHFAVDGKLRGDRLEVHYNPFQTSSEPEEVELYDLHGVYLGVGRLYQRERGHHPQPTAPPLRQQPIEPAYLDALNDGEVIRQQQRRQAGLDYQSASQRNILPLSQFVAHLAKRLGREGLASLTPDELEALQAFHSRHDRLNDTLLSAAVARADSPTIPCVLLQLQSLLLERDD